MYTAQQIANSIASDAALPAGSNTGPQQSEQANAMPYPLVSAGGMQQQEWIGAGGTQQYPYGRDNAWDQQNWGNPSGSMPSTPAGGMFSQWSSADWVTGDHAASAPAPSPWAGQQSNAAKAFDLTSGGNCSISQDMYNDEKQSLYAGHRLFGNIRLAQGKGDVGEVLLNGTATVVNPALLSSAVEGRDQVYATADAYRDSANTFTPFAAMGGSVGGIRPELYVGTVSEGLSAPPKSETMTQRAFLPSDMPSTFNIYPESEAAAARKENTCRLNRIQANYIASRLKAASTMAW